MLDEFDKLKPFIIPLLTSFISAFKVDTSLPFSPCLSSASSCLSYASTHNSFSSVVGIMMKLVRQGAVALFRKSTILPRESVYIENTVI